MRRCAQEPVDPLALQVAERIGLNKRDTATFVAAYNGDYEQRLDAYCVLMTRASKIYEALIMRAVKRGAKPATTSSRAKASPKRGSRGKKRKRAA